MSKRKRNVLTIEHRKYTNGKSGTFVTGVSGCDGPHDCYRIHCDCAYAVDLPRMTGKTGPRYPVPAIPLTVDYYWDCVGVFAWNGDTDKVVASFVKR